MDELARQKLTNAQQYFQRHQEDFTQPANTLFVGCVDSRVAPEMLLGKTPGEMVVVRIPGAFVPAQGLGDASVSATIELALSKAETIRDIIVCGHTKCLMVNTLANDADAFETPNLARWAVMSDFVRAQATTRADKHENPASYEQALLEESIKRSLDSLRELPIVREREDAGQLNLHGWYYDLHNGNLVVYNASQNTFERLGTDGSVSTTSLTNAYYDQAETLESNSRTEYQEDRQSNTIHDAVVTGSVVGTSAALANKLVAEESVAPESVAPEIVETPSVAPETVAPNPINVPRGQPVQRVYTSEVSRAPNDNADIVSQAPDPNPFDTSLIDQVEAFEPEILMPSNVQEALDDPALDDMKALLGNMKRPSGRLQVRRTLNEINTRDGWLNVAKAVNEMRDPHVQQALREVAFELRSPQARAELRQIISDLDAGQLAQKLTNLNPQQIQTEFQQLIQQLRNEDK